MCGIAGAFSTFGAPVDREVLARMAATLDHRGPDDHRAWFGSGVAFGHTRLAIIDLSTSVQPMTGPCGRTLAFNGEILNYRELRSRLDYPFRTAGDTETILAAVDQWGVEKAVSEFRGQFAFALHDPDRGSVVLARDRLGIIPMYYAETPGQVVFGSEIKALLAGMPNRPGVDLGVLDEYLTRRAVPAPRTLFDGVLKLPPGQLVEITEAGVGSPRPYWSSDFRADVTSFSTAVDEVERLLKASVLEAFEADVPVGAYLSGGVDSSLICALARQVRPAPLSTFSAGFGAHRDDETGYARTVAERLGTDHHEITVDPTVFAESWPKLTWHRDAPLSEPADLAVFQLARQARQTVKVVLSGEGSDELFGGYPKYRFTRRAQLVDHLPPRVRAGLFATAAAALPARYDRVRTALRALGGASDERDLAWFAPFTASERRALLGPLTGASPVRTSASFDDPVQRLLAVDQGSWLADNLLERGDRMSMAASLELRPPFLDARVVEYARSISPEVLLHEGRTKAVVKEIARRYLPAEIVDRRKVGFRVPLDAWFRDGLRDHMHDLLLDQGSFVASTMDRDRVAALLRSHDRGYRNEQIRIWTLASLEMWHRVAVCGEFVPDVRPVGGREGPSR